MKKTRLPDRVGLALLLRCAQEMNHLASILPELHAAAGGRTARRIDLIRYQRRWYPEYLTPRIEDRALELQSALAQGGQHRAPSIPDLLIAATAELAELTVLHLDKGFELVGDITGQPVERVDVT